jgi:hypothetical protein
MEIVRSHQGDGYRVILSFISDEGWFVEVHDNSKRSTECGPVGRRKARTVFAMACRASGFVGACVAVHNGKAA